MADGRINIDSRIETSNLRRDAQEVNSTMERMARQISQSMDGTARSGERSFKQLSRYSQGSMREIEGTARASFRGMIGAAQQSYEAQTAAADRAARQQAQASQQANQQVTDGYMSEWRQREAAARAHYNSLGTAERAMHNEMRAAWRQSAAGMAEHNNALVRAQYGYFQLSQRMGDYRGTTAQFMNQVDQLGAAHKRATDAAINGNTMARMTMIQTAGQMMNMSTQADKITQNYQRMNNPLLRINAGGLAAANALNRMALAGNASVLALKMLGPNASMKALVDMQNMITQGQMRIGMVAMATAVTAGLAYKALWTAAKGPDPSKIYAEQEAALQKYKDAVVARTTEIVNTWNIFEKAQTKATNPATLMTNLQGQVNVMKNWNANLNSIAQKAPKEFADYLSQLGPKAAGEVAAINSMSQPELDKYVALWQEKTRLAKERATTELEGLKAQTMAKIKELGDSLTPLGIAFEKFKQTWTQALEPMVQAFSNVMTPLVEFGTKIGELVIKFNEANPTMAMFIQGAIMLVPALMLLLSPLAAGVGFFNGLKVAMAGAWAIIGPLVTGLGAMTATVWIVAAAIAGLAIGFIALWNNSETFRNGVIAGWEAIKNAALVIWNFLLTQAIQPAMEAITTFVNEKLAQLKLFWDTNGAAITQAATNAWNGIVTACQVAMNFLQPIFEIAWMIIKEIVIGTWEAIKNVINGALNIIMGIVQVFSGLFTGNWTMVWEGVKQIWNGALELIWGWFQLWGVGRILGFLGKFVGKFAKYFSDVWAKVKSIWNDTITEIWFFFATKFEAIGNFGRSFMNTLKSMFQSVWNAIKSVWNTVISSISSFVSSIFNSIKSFLTSIMNAIKSVFSSVWNAIKSVVSSVINAIKSVIQSGMQSASSVVSSVLNTMRSIFTTIWNAIKQVVTSAINAVKSVIQAGMSAAQSIVSSIGNAIKSAFTQIWSSFSQVVSSAFNSVKSAITSGLQAGVNIVKNFGATFMAAGKGLIDMMAKGIMGAASKVTEAIKGIAQKARDFLPFSPAKTGPLSDIDKLDFGGPISDAIGKSEKGVQVELTRMLNVPVLGAGLSNRVASSNNITHNNSGGNTAQITVNIDPRNMEEFEQVINFFDTFKQTKRARG